MAYATFYERLGGRPTFEKVHKLFYDKVYEHPWLKLFFAKVEQKHIESQQTDFVAQSEGVVEPGLGFRARNHQEVQRRMPTPHSHRRNCGISEATAFLASLLLTFWQETS